jgi:nicotinate dehydrogenase subunit A
MASFQLNVNNTAHTVDCDEDTPLLYVLRDELSYANPRFGCGLAQCGSCTVLLNGRPIRSCVLPIAAINGNITTIEGIGTESSPHPVQTAFIKEQAMFCGYCMNGWILEAVAYLDENPSPNESDIRRHFSALKCRCGSHPAIIRAVLRASVSHA